MEIKNALDAILPSLLGMLVVFIMLALIMGVIYIISAIFRPKKQELIEESYEAAPAELAPGSAGGVMLYDTPDRAAAMIMAIVADKMKKPLNQLRFISIKRVK